MEQLSWDFTSCVMVRTLWALCNTTLVHNEDGKKILITDKCLVVWVSEGTIIHMKNFLYIFLCSEKCSSHWLHDVFFGQSCGVIIHIVALHSRGLGLTRRKISKMLEKYLRYRPFPMMEARISKWWGGKKNQYFSRCVCVKSLQCKNNYFIINERAVGSIFAMSCWSKAELLLLPHARQNRRGFFPEKPNICSLLEKFN